MPDKNGIYNYKSVKTENGSKQWFNRTILNELGFVCFIFWIINMLKTIYVYDILNEVYSLLSKKIFLIYLKTIRIVKQNSYWILRNH